MLPSHKLTEKNP